MSTDTEDLESEDVEESEETPPGEEQPEETITDEEKPVFLGDDEPSGKENRAKYWLMRGLTDEDIVAKGINSGTVRIARSHLIKDGYLKKEPRSSAGGKKASPGTAITPGAPQKGLQVFAKGSPPEAIIESISIPMVDGQGVGFEQGMKFGMSTLVLAIRVMQEMSAVGIQQVKPLIDLTRSVRDGEGAAFKSGADEAAMKAAQAMGQTILPMISEMQSSVTAAARGGEADPMKSMMVRTMEPMMKSLLGRVVPGMKDEPPAGWSKRQE